jgi:Tol biopolymer transport system component
LFRDGLSILLEEANGKPPRRLFIGPASVEGWNPDGSAILTQLTGSQGGFRLYLLSIADGSRKQLVGSHENAYLAFPKWLPDGSGFFFCLFRAADSRRYRRSLWTDAAYTWEDSQIWFCSVPQGELHQVTQSAPGYLQLNGISPDGTTLMAIRNVYPPGFWELSARLFGQWIGMESPKLVRLKLKSRS